VANAPRSLGGVHQRHRPRGAARWRSLRLLDEDALHGTPDPVRRWGAVRRRRGRRAVEQPAGHRVVLEHDPARLRARRQLGDRRSEGEPVRPLPCRGPAGGRARHEPAHQRPGRLSPLPGRRRRLAVHAEWPRLHRCRAASRGEREPQSDRPTQLRHRRHGLRLQRDTSRLGVLDRRHELRDGHDDGGGHAPRRPGSGPRGTAGHRRRWRRACVALRRHAARDPAGRRRGRGLVRTPAFPRADLHSSGNRAAKRVRGHLGVLQRRS
jgi:hypothetical protein